jgi:uncharacterized protein with HEPN domain
MQRDARAFLSDAQAAAAQILAFTRNRAWNDYRADALLRSAVERQFEILGEALNRLSRRDSALAARVPELRRIVDFRNVLAHAYAIVDDLLVWQAVERNVPALLDTLTALLEELPDADLH